jgi:uncharacterized protein
VLEPSSPGISLSDSDLARLDSLLASLPEPLQPPDVSALDGYLCGVLLQPRPIAAAQWLPWVNDVEGRPAAASPALQELLALVLRRHAELRTRHRRSATGSTPGSTSWTTKPPVRHACCPGWPASPPRWRPFPGAAWRCPSPELIEPLALLYHALRRRRPRRR